MIFQKKDFITMMETTADEIHYILETADTMRHILSQKNKKAPYLRGKSIIMLFYENTSRTKVSYELAGQYLSADIVDMTLSHQLAEDSSIIDMGKIVDQMGPDFIIIRHPLSGSAQLLAENVSASVINAGDGTNENPSQSLLDLLTIKSQKGSFKGLKVTFIGDVANSRVTHSNIWGLLKLSAQVCVAGPPTLIPSKLSSFGVEVYYDAHKAAKDADVIMSIRLGKEEDYKNILPSFNEYKNFFKIDKAMLSHAKKDVIVMHPGPINRGIEIASEVIDSGQCLVNDQISNGVAVRMALMYLLNARGGLSL